MKMFVGDTPSVTEFLADVVPEGGTVGFDGRVMSMGEGEEFEEALTPKNIKINYSEDLIDEIWETVRLFPRSRPSSWKKSILEKALLPSLQESVKR